MENLENASYEKWVKKSSVVNKFKKDYRKLQILKISPWAMLITLFLTIFFLIFSMALKNGSKFFSIAFFISLLLFVISLSLQISSIYTKLSKKEFVVFILRKLANRMREGKESDDDKKELLKDINLLKKIFDKLEISENKEIFEYKKWNYLKKELRNLSIYLHENLDKIDEMNGWALLNNLARLIHNERNPDEISNIIKKRHKEEIKEEKTLMGKLKEGSPLILISLIVLTFVLAGIFLDVQKEYIYAFGGICILAWIRWIYKKYKKNE